MTKLVPTLSTRRLRLRGWAVADRAALAAIKADAANWRFIASGPLDAGEASAQLDVLLDEWERWGVGSWAIVEAETRELIGDCGVKLTDRGPQLAYMIARKRWGKGFATEASRAVLHYAFANCGWPAIYASTDIANLASQRVLEKVGMRLQRTIDGPHGRERWYEIRRDELHSTCEPPTAAPPRGSRRRRPTPPPRPAPTDRGAPAPP